MLSQNVRSIFYGSEVMRLQRGRNEVKLMVRYPEEERNSYAGFEEIRIRDNQGNAHPLTEVANLEFSRAPAEINRINGYRSITVTADMDKANEANSAAIIEEMKNGSLVANYANAGKWAARGYWFRRDGEIAKDPSELLTSEEQDQLNEVESAQLDQRSKELKLSDTQQSFKGFEVGNYDPSKSPDFKQISFINALIASYQNQEGVILQVDWEGEAQDSNDAFASMQVGFLIAMLAMYVLLTLAFRSYMQPLIILSIIPFGAIGAIFGHAVLGLDLTLFSFFGLIALTGVIVNDSIVLVDFINRHAREYNSLNDALVAAGMRRFRPIMLTSFTTVAGLFPMLMEKSFQAQVLIPMAASLVFGLMTGTILILFLVPVFYRIYVSVFELGTGMSFKIEDGLAADPQTANAPEDGQRDRESVPKSEPVEAQPV